MYFSKDTFDNLELNFILDNINVYTPYGLEYKNALKPYDISCEEELVKELDRIEKVIKLIEKHRYDFVELRNVFKHLKDLTNTFKRLKEGQVLGVVELFEIKSFMLFIQDIDNVLRKIGWDISQQTTPTPIEEVTRILDPEDIKVHTYYIYDAYSKKLSMIREELRSIDGEYKLLKKNLKVRVEEELDIRLRPNGEVTLNKDDKDRIEQFKKYAHLHYSQETFMNITFKLVTTEEMDSLDCKLQELKIQEEREELEVRKKICSQLRKFSEAIEDNLQCIGRLDLIIAKAYFSIGFNCVKPTVAAEGIQIHGGRNIKLELHLRKDDKEFTPIDIDINRGVTCITGANMGGKTVALKTLGMIAVMVHYGLFVPADKVSMPLRDFIFISIGDMQSIDMGLSTFGGEILKLREILDRADEKGIILIDELARGTNPKEGYAISKAIINYLKDKNTVTMITTHFDGLADDKDVKHLQVQGISPEDFKKISELIEDKNEGVALLHEYMNYKLREIKEVKEVPKDAINISRLMGLDEEILMDAEGIMNSN